MDLAHVWHLASRPSGLPGPENFALLEKELPALQPDEVRVRNTWLSVDPITRVRMLENNASGLPGLSVGDPITGVAIGEVVETRSAHLAIGDKVKHHFGWRDEVVAPAESFSKLPAIDAPERYFLHYLGIVGFTAYCGLVKIAGSRAGETLFVSAAAGAVGSAAVQIGKMIGMRVVASAGGPDKCAFVRRLGAEAAIDYKAPGRLVDKLKSAAPQGIDVYFDNVGGDHLDAALACANVGARFAISGAIGGYNAEPAPPIANLSRILWASITVRGFMTARDFGDDLTEFQQIMARWIAEGRIAVQENVRGGLENTAAAFVELFTGNVPGKILVRL